MKKLLLFFAIIISVLTAVAQNPRSSSAQAAKNDVILKTNGDEVLGTIKEITDNEIKFTHEGESLIYTVKKEDILKVTFASGRIEFYNRSGSSSGPKENQNTTENRPAAPALADHHNKVAILPFSFIRENQSAGDDMAYKVQQDAYELLSEHSGGLTILDPRTTNSMLMKAGVTRQNMMGYTMDEICNILGVEFVVEGSVNIAKGMNTSSTYTQVTPSKSGKKPALTGSTYSSGGQLYSTTVALNVYTDKNSNIFNDSHKGFLASMDASYSSPLKYLLKRTPLYRK